MQRVEDQLGADEPEDHGEPAPEEHEALEQPTQQEEQLHQAHQREGVRGEHEVGLLGQPEDRRDRVESKQHVGTPDRNHDGEHRREDATAVDDGTNPLAVVVAAGRQDPRRGAHQQIVLALGALGALGPPVALGDLVVAVTAPDQTDRGPDQETAENVEHPREAGDEHRAGGDEQPPQDERQHDAHQQDRLLVGRRHLEPGHDDHEDEQVVERQAVLGQPARIELAAEAAAPPRIDPDTEEQGQGHVDAHGEAGLPHRGPAPPPAHDEEVDREDAEDEGQRDTPDRRTHPHGRPLIAGSEPRAPIHPGVRAWAGGPRPSRTSRRRGSASRRQRPIRRARRDSRAGCPGRALDRCCPGSAPATPRHRPARTAPTPRAALGRRRFRRTGRSSCRP